MKLDKIITKIWKQAHDLGRRGYEINHIPVNDIKKHIVEWAVECIPKALDWAHDKEAKLVAEGFEMCVKETKKNLQDNDMQS
jgi:hypothetical protein